MGRLGTMQALIGPVGGNYGYSRGAFLGSSVNLSNFRMHGAANFSPSLCLKCEAEANATQSPNPHPRLYLGVAKSQSQLQSHERRHIKSNTVVVAYGMYRHIRV